MATDTVMEKREGTNQPEAMQGGPFYRPYADIYELENEYLVRADVPGAEADKIDITYEQGLLTLHAAVPERHDVRSTRWLLREYGEGDYRRTFRVGEGVDPSGISAEYKHGVLTLHLPKSQEVLPRKIQVAVK